MSKYEQATAAPGEVRNLPTPPKKAHTSDVVIEATIPGVGTQRWVVTGESFFVQEYSNYNATKITIGGRVDA